MNAIEPLNAVRTQLEARDTELTTSLESIEREREIVRKQLGLVQELESLEEQRAGTGTSPVLATPPSPAGTARTASQPAAAAVAALDASETGSTASEAVKAESAKADSAKPAAAPAELAKSEPVRPDAAKPEPAKPGIEAPAAKDEPAAAPFGRGPSPWPRSAGEPDTELLRRIRAS